MTPYQRHKKKWSNCKRCDLCKHRKYVVLYRGVVPCDVLFVGEGPGDGEDRLAQPFVGPAGNLLDNIIAPANDGNDLRLGFTNLVACIPKDENNNKIGEPKKAHIKECSERLDEMIGLAAPKLLVCVGKLAAKYLVDYNIDKVEITHPAAILKSDVNQAFAAQQATVILADAFSEL